MAQMFPSSGPVETESGAERRLYDLFSRSLSDDYRVIHSTNWHAVDERGRVSDGEADFIIIHPAHGVLVLEVKGGRVSRDGRTKKWQTKDVSGRSAPIKDPFQQAMKSMHVLIRCLQRAPETKPYAGTFRVGYGVWFPDIEWPRSGAGALQAYENLVLDVHQLHAPEEALLTLYRHFATQSHRPTLSEQAIDALVSLLSPTIEAKSSLAMEIAGEETRIKQLTQAQYERLQAMWSTHRQLAVPGAAGTGKTVLAMEMAWRLAAEGLDVLLLCANQYLADWLTYRMERDPRPLKPHINIHSMKSLVTALAERGGLRLNEIGPLRMTSPTHQKTLSSILTHNIRVLEQRGEAMPCDAILVDEAQDIEQALWVPIQKLLRDRTDGFLYVFYDEKQRIDLSGNWVFRPAGTRSYFPLTANCRNTQTIYELMARFNPELTRYSFDGPPGRPVQYVATPPASLSQNDSPAEYYALLAQTLADLFEGEGGLRPEDVLVISCRAETKSHYYRAEHRVVGKHTLHWLRRGERDGYVPLATIRSAKGLEYKVVILIELDGLREESKREGLLYVAVSRAMHHLIVFGSEEELLGSRQPSLWEGLVAATRRGGAN